MPSGIISLIFSPILMWGIILFLKNPNSEFPMIRYFLSDKLKKLSDKGRKTALSTLLLDLNQQVLTELLDEIERIVTQIYEVITVASSRHLQSFDQHLSSASS